MLLLVEDDAMTARTLVRLIGDGSEVVATESATTALELVRSRTDLAGALVDAGLPEGPLAGLEVARAIRETHPECPTAIVTGGLVVDLVNRAYLLDVPVIAKPPGRAEIDRFLGRVRTAQPPSERAHAESAAERLVENGAREYQLTERELDIVRWVAGGHEVTAYAANRGIRRSTLRTHVKRILDKTNAPNLSVLAIRLLRGDST